jgi:hypothetical protein
MVLKLFLHLRVSFYFELVSVATQPSMDIIWLIKLEVGELITGIRSCNLQGSEVRKRWKISLNQSLIYIHPFPSLTFLLALLQQSSQKTIVRWKKYWRGIPSPPVTSTQPVSPCTITFTHCNVTLATRKLSEPHNSSPNHSSFQQCLWLEFLYLNVFLAHTHGADSTEVTSHW